MNVFVPWRFWFGASSSQKLADARPYTQTFLRMLSSLWSLLFGLVPSSSAASVRCVVKWIPQTERRVPHHTANLAVWSPASRPPSAPPHLHPPLTPDFLFAGGFHWAVAKNVFWFWIAHGHAQCCLLFCFMSTCLGETACRDQISVLLLDAARERESIATRITGRRFCTRFTCSRFYTFHRSSVVQVVKCWSPIPRTFHRP